MSLQVDNEFKQVEMKDLNDENNVGGSKAFDAE